MLVEAWDVVVSHAYLTSVYEQQVWQAVQADDRRGFERKLIPVRVEDCSLPGLLGKIVSFDIFGMDDQGARAHLLQKIKNILDGRAKPTEPPLYPGGRTQPRRSDSRSSMAADPARRLGSILDHTGRVSALAFNETGSVLATGGSDCKVILWDAAAGSPPRFATTLNGYDGQITGLSFGDLHGTLLATGSADWNLTLWDVSNPSQPQKATTVRGHRGRVTAMAFAPGGRYIATGGADGVVRLWDAADPEHLSELMAASVHGRDVTAVSFPTDRGLLATCDGEGTYVLWDVMDPAHPCQTARMGGDGQTAVAALSADGKLLVVGGVGGTSAVWDVTSPSAPARLAEQQAHLGGDVTALAFNPIDATVLASGGSDGLVSVWNLTVPSTPDRVRAIRDHRSRVEALEFSRDGCVLATGSADTTVGLWAIG